MLLVVYLIAKYVFHISWYMDDTGQEKSSGQRVRFFGIMAVNNSLIRLYFLGGKIGEVP